MKQRGSKSDMALRASALQLGVAASANADSATVAGELAAAPAALPLGLSACSFPEIEEIDLLSDSEGQPRQSAATEVIDLCDSGDEAAPLNDWGRLVDLTDDLPLDDRQTKQQPQQKQQQQPQPRSASQQGPQQRPL
mmetsp:Transcript_8068/g.23977  ORF Transcript_8068/g.23977 Transcript_8068/m.23977 type:complete len:137 (-) Transcript_8068:1997-2407(-)